MIDSSETRERCGELGTPSIELSVAFGNFLLEVAEYSGCESDGREVEICGDVVNKSSAIDKVGHG